MLRPWALVKDDISNRLSLKFAEISSNGFSVLVFIYRAEAVGRALSSEGARRLLEELGYGESLRSVDSCVGEVVRRSRGGIQHEIGIFLGYPPEDVRGFMENRGRNSKLSGYWKVYGDAVCALKKFEEYKMAETLSARNLLAKAGFQDENSSSAVHA
jgi:hypothetical protein